MKYSLSIVLFLLALCTSAQEYKKMFEDENIEYYVYSECDFDEYGHCLLWTKNVPKDSKITSIRNQYVKKYNDQGFNRLSYYIQLFKLDFDSKKVCIPTTIYYDSTKNIIKKVTSYELEYVQPETIAARIYKIAKQMSKTNEESHDDTSSSQYEEKVYDVVEQMPQFRGGQAALFEYFSKNIQYPEDAKREGIQGRNVVTFIVENDGSISNCKIVYSLYPSLDKEAIRLVENMPKWIAGRQNGKNIRVKYTIPVTFRL